MAQEKHELVRGLTLYGIKEGCTSLYDDQGKRIPVTVVRFDHNVVTQVKTEKRDGYSALQLAVKSAKSRANKAQEGHLKAAGLSGGYQMQEVRLVEPCDDYQVGDRITVKAFEKVRYVDVTGTTVGKGFQGAVKRHGFSMQDATHGNSKAHRALGSTGQCQFPGRVFKGKKMAGHMGNVQRTAVKLEVVRVHEGENYMLIKGAVPGPKGGLVSVARSTRKAHQE